MNTTTKERPSKQDILIINPDYILKAIEELEQLEAVAKVREATRYLDAILTTGNAVRIEHVPNADDQRPETITMIYCCALPLICDHPLKEHLIRRIKYYVIEYPMIDETDCDYNKRPQGYTMILPLRVNHTKITV